MQAVLREEEGMLLQVSVQLANLTNEFVIGSVHLTQPSGIISCRETLNQECDEGPVNADHSECITVQ